MCCMSPLLMSGLRKLFGVTKGVAEAACGGTSILLTNLFKIAMMKTWFANYYIALTIHFSDFVLR